ncbi:MAG: hypothetical protein DWQ05_15290 [Calditrichaeota bacterium]|nr:MAG: hypothetical protein DWQ05_15290 [Calditrichota bacterium]
MTQQTHIIKRQIIELETSGSRNQQQRFQHELSRIYRNKIIAAIDHWCSALSDSNQIIRLDSVELDLGDIDQTDFEIIFVSKFNEELEKELTKQIVELTRTHGGNGHHTKIESQLELLSHFAHTGCLPWWADSSNAFLLNDGLKFLLGSAPGKLRQLIRELSSEKQAMARLNYHYSDTELQNLLELIAPNIGAAIQFQFGKIIQAIQQANPGQSREKTRRSFWINLFSSARYVQNFSTPDAYFYRALFARIAADSGLHYDVLITKLNDVIHAEKSENTGDLRRIFDKLFQERQMPQTAASFPKTIDEMSDSSRHLNALITAIRKLMDQMPEENRKQFLQRLAAAKSGNFSSDDLRIFFTKQSLPGALIDNVLAALDICLTDNRTPKRAPELVQLIRNEIEQSDDLPLYPGFSAADELYVANAGLVLLWPFIKSFFSLLKLTDDKRFLQRNLQIHAVYLLQYLVESITEIPEFVLPLNKILCGLDPADIVEPVADITDYEMDESTRFLTEVIQQAPILREMSIQGFRHTFLLRKGILRARDSSWLLQVERETHDVVLDRFPWGWEWIKLPWMATAIRVEW